MHSILSLLPQYKANSRGILDRAKDLVSATGEGKGK